VKNEPEKYGWNGFRLLKENKPDSAIQLFQKALALDGKDQEILMALGEAYIGLGLKDSGTKYIDRAAAIGGSDFKTIMNAGDAYLKAGLIDKAQALFLGLANSGGQNAAHGLLGLAQVQLSQGNLDVAIQNANNAMAANPQLTGNAYQLLAYIYQQKGDITTARRYMEALRGGQ
jgi:tetratricopeptide (TPR) repeat protein